MSGSALFTDLYQLTMMAGYHAAGLTAPASFELYIRSLPRNRSYLVAAGLDGALGYLESVRFSRDDIAHLRALPALRGVRDEFFDEYLARFRFTGDVWAVPEGTPVFPPAPLLRVTAPLPEAQLVETALLAQVGFQTSVASRASRIAAAANGRAVVEFGARRAHGLEAGVLAARAAYLAGCQSTSNVEAGRRFGIPVAGTMAHAWVTAFPDERAAFAAYARVFGERTVLLLDTYDTLAAARSLKGSGLRPSAVRIDSGDIVALSRAVRAILDDAGLRETAIFVSGDLDEWRIADIVATGAPIDGYGVGAAISTSGDVPSSGAIYKLVEIERQGEAVPIMKLSEDKHTLPGRKQVWRLLERGQSVADVIGLADEPPIAGARPLLQQVMAGGRRTGSTRSLGEARSACAAEVAQLPADVRALDARAPYPVRISDALQKLIERYTVARASAGG